MVVKRFLSLNKDEPEGKNILMSLCGQRDDPYEDR
jgi:hypothetical protein